MNVTLLKNDIKQKPLFAIATVIFMGISALLIGLTCLLASNLLGSIDHLMSVGISPDYLQMHQGELDEKEIASFVGQQEDVEDYQICHFLNLDNNELWLGEQSLSDNTQDNGLCVQGEHFDFLLDLNNQKPVVKPGQVFVPACYESMYQLSIGDVFRIEEETLEIAGFIRDSQMNSMMASSKRFLVCEEDYNRLLSKGAEEYLIEFMLKSDDTGSFTTAYTNAKLPANGPVITRPLIKIMNALSDGMMIMVIFLTGLIVLGISLVCIRFILITQMESDRKELGLQKALGIPKKKLQKRYLWKYLFFSALGGCMGLLGAWILKNLLLEQMMRLYGVSAGGIGSMVIAILTVAMIEGLIMLFISKTIGKFQRISTLEALFEHAKQRKVWKQHVLMTGMIAACVFLMVIPQNLYHTIMDSSFVSYMGIGESELCIDVRNGENLKERTAALEQTLKQDSQVESYVVLSTAAYTAKAGDGDEYHIVITKGNHTAFPISYLEGEAPKEAGEIALSVMQAKELACGLGDSILITEQGKEERLLVCGIYSDITNGGRTAKVKELECETPVMWSTAYANLAEGTNKDAWIQTMSQEGQKVVDIKQRILNTYGQTMKQIQYASVVSVVVACIIVFVVLTLFFSMLTEEKRYEISLKKALGVTNRTIYRDYLMQGVICSVIGSILGVLGGVTLGESLCGMVMEQFGATGLSFVIPVGIVYVLIPLLTIMVTLAGIGVGLGRVKTMKPYECCMGKE